MNRRTFNAAELARIFKAQANEDNKYRIDLGDGLVAVQMAKGDGLLFTIEKSGELIGRGRKFSDEFGNPKLLSEMTRPELEEISGILWAKYEPFLPDDPADDLIPDELKDKPDPLAGTIEGLIPEELRTPPDSDPLSYPGDK